MIGGTLLSLLLSAQAVSMPLMEEDATPVVTEQELSQVRGGFSLSSVDISFGAEIRTYLDDELVLQTNLTWGPSGATRSEYVSAALTRPSHDELQSGLLSGHGISMRLGDQTAYLANGGHTALVHRTDGGIQNILINTANGIDARQEVDATIDIHNSVDFTHSVSMERLGDALGAAAGDGVAAGFDF